MRTLRNLLPNQAALEAEALEQARQQILTTPMFSLEEEAIEVGEQTQAAQDIIADVNDTNRVVELTDALEDLAAIAESITSATPAETQLIETAGQVAVAGTDVAPDEIVPAMESFVGTAIATESIADMRMKAKQIWAKILEFVQKIWAKIKDFIYRAVGSVPRLRRTIAELQAKADEIGDKKAEGDLEITNGQAALSVNYHVVKSPAEVKKAVENLSAGADYVFGKLSSTVLERGKVIEEAIKGFDASKAADATAALHTGLGNAVPVKAPGMAGADKSRFPGYDCFVGEALLGNVSIAYRHWNENKEASVLGSLDRKRNSGFDLIPTSEKSQPAPSQSTKMAVLSQSEIQALLKDLSGVLDTVEKFDKGGMAGDIEKQAKDIQKASSDAEKKLAGFKSQSTSDENNSVTHYRALLNFNAAFASWAAKPAVPMVSHTLRSVRAVLVLVQKSLAAYK